MKFLLTILFIFQVKALDKVWWKHSVIYEIYFPSFKDSDGDGWGDLKGITSKLDYLKDLGVDAIWLTPFFPSPMIDTGYDVSNYVGINPLFGTMADFDNLMRQLKRRGMKLIVDLVINHSSDKHQWFQKSVHKIKPYTDYYIWKDPKGKNETGHPIPPNNWISFLGTSAWKWNEKRQQFYYHVLLPEQPDLNLRNPRVKNEVNKIMKFWCDKGVAGLRLDATNVLMEDPSFEDEPLFDTRGPTSGKTFTFFEGKQKTINRDENFEYLRELRKTLNKISFQAKNYEIILIPEMWGTPEIYGKSYGNKTDPAAHFPFNFLFLRLENYINSNGLNDLIHSWINAAPENSTPNWLIGSHDVRRPVFKYIQEYVHIWLTLITLLPGVTVLYYGDEIGMTSGVVQPIHIKWQSEFSRTPMQWDESSSGGFTTNKKTWLPVNPNYWRLNLKQQQKDPHSTYNFLKKLLKLKKTDTIKYGDLNTYILSDWIFAFKRSYEDFEDHIAVINLGTENESVSLESKIQALPAILKVRLASSNSILNEDDMITKGNNYQFTMTPMSVIVFYEEFEDEMPTADFRGNALSTLSKNIV